MGPPLALLLLLLLLPRGPPAAPATRARPLPGLLGCLFEDGLCRPSETCVDDAVFGRCQKVPVIDIYRYEVSPVVLQHLTATLQKLSHTGFTWQDDYTQHVMAQELSNLPKTYPQHPESSNPARTSMQSVDNEKRYSQEGDIALAKALQRYLPYLEALSQATTSNLLPRMKHGRPPSEGEDALAESVLTYVAQTSALTYAPMPREDYPAGHPLRTLSRLQPDELSPKVVGSVDRQNLVAALGAYAAQKHPPPPREGDPGLHNLLHAPWREPRVLSAPATPQKWPLSPGDPKHPLGRGDEALIQSLLKDLRRHQVDMASLSPLDPEEMARVIANAMQGVGTEGEREEAGMGVGGEPGEQVDSPEAGLHEARKVGDVRDNRVQDDDDRVYEEVNRLSLTLGDLLQDPGSQFLPGAPPLVESFKTEIKKSEDPGASLSSEEESAGVENVRSQTYVKELLERPQVDGFGEFQRQIPGAWKEDRRLEAGAQERSGEGLELEVQPSEESGYIVTETDPLSLEKGKELLAGVARLLEVPMSVFVDIDVVGPAVTFKVSANVLNVTTAEAVEAAVENKDNLEKTSGLKILQTGVGSKSKLKLRPHQAEQEDSTKFIVLTLISVAAILGVLLASGVIYCLRHSSHYRLKEKLSGPGGHAGLDATAYQELCRQRMAVRTSDRPEAPHTSRISSVSSQFSDGPMPSPSARSSTSSWSEEPAQPNMDISTGHMVLAYMEDHLKNKNRLEKEWEALCAYQAEPSSSLVAQREENVPKNRCPAVLTYDHSRILLKSENSHSNSDYINASPIMDHDPRNPAYIATQGPLPATVADFWQMVWESGCVVIVMLTPLSENGVRQCYHYWPDEGSNLYHIYEVNLVSEHIWCEDFLVRSFYLKNLQTNETRTVTQFHFLSWYDQGVPSSTRSLLDFRRKVNKCYRGRSCPIIVHCSDGAGRSGTYVLIDMVLNKMAKGAKEIDIAATLEHLRDQRPGMVQTKEQFEFALTAVAEEVNAILKALPQ
ncbi:receptor-type tyrosine-protein phosphatase N2 isoform X4 [Equus przewalskii]|uniref:Protein tyrosine phosphatase receptor type N2 n=3 Tax=Equus TaxID=9789 RepID=A0A9L0RHF7_HORSE|nr:receptor-type tyrosine-protein phosphatase N2 isoform X4 [Equus caballus]